MAKQFKPMPVQRPLTEQEKQAKIMQFLQQKREQFSINILCNLCQGADTNETLHKGSCKALVDMAVEMADALMETLYPIKEESK